MAKRVRRTESGEGREEILAVRVDSDWGNPCVSVSGQHAPTSTARDRDRRPEIGLPLFR